MMRFMGFSGFLVKVKEKCSYQGITRVAGEPVPLSTEPGGKVVVLCRPRLADHRCRIKVYRKECRLR